MVWTKFNSMWTLLHREDTVISPNENIYVIMHEIYIYIYICNYVNSHLHYTWLCSNSSCIYKVQILIVGWVIRI